MLEFDIAGQHYTLLPGTERFYTDDPEKAITLYKIISEAYSSDFKSLRQRILVPDDFYKISDAGRRRILRAYQLHVSSPEWKPEYEDLMAPIDRVGIQMEENLEMPAQYKAALWAADNDPYKAISLIVNWGWANSPKRLPVKKISIYRLIKTSAGITIDVQYGHTFNERLTAACTGVHYLYHKNQANGLKNDFGTLLNSAMRDFFFYRKTWISAPPQFNMMIKGHVQSYIDKLFSPKFARRDPPIPEIEEPTEDMMLSEDEPIFLPWDQFQLVKSTPEMISQRDKINQQRHLKAIQERWKDLPQGVLLHRRDLNVSSSETLQRAIDFGYAENPKRGFYILHFPKEGE